MKTTNAALRAGSSRTGLSGMTAMSAALLVLLLTFGSQNLGAQSTGFSGSARAHSYVSSLVGPTALLGIAAATAVDQIGDDPPEWNVWNRALSNAGRLAVQTTIHHGLAAVMDRSTWYYRCDCTDTGARIGHAFAEVVTDHDRAGHTHFGIARIAGAYGGAWAETTWRPDRESGDIFINGTTTLVGTGLVNLWREFFQHPKHATR